MHPAATQLEQLADGSLHLTPVALLGRHLTTENHRELLAAARHKSKRQLEEIIAALRPKPPVPPTIRKLPASSAPSTSATTSQPRVFAAHPPAPVSAGVPAIAPPPRTVEIKPLAPEQYRVQFTASRETYDKLRQAQDLLRHRIPTGDVAATVDRALTLLLTELYRTTRAAVDRPRPGTSSSPRGRHIPAAVKRAVWQRNSGRCAFVGTRGRCQERGFLEYHHVVPYADGGAWVADNLELRCRAHNGYDADRWFGVREEGQVLEGKASFQCDAAGRLLYGSCA